MSSLFPIKMFPKRFGTFYQMMEEKTSGLFCPRCLLPGNQDEYRFLCFLNMDSLDRVKEIAVTNDPRYDFDIFS